MRNELIQCLIAVGRRLDQKRLIAGTEGNLSARYRKDEIMITASGTFKGLLQDTDFVIVDIHGNHLHGKGQASSEQWLHLTVYRLRPDVQTVIHAHPPHALALMLAGGSMEGVPFPEAAYILGSVPTCDFAIPGTPEGGKAIEPWIINREALLLDRHGAVTVGRSMEEALARMESLDFLAQVMLLAGKTKEIQGFTEEQVSRIIQAAGKSGIPPESIKHWAKMVTK